MKTYLVREVFKTIQGEGARAGSSAVFVRFAGCNRWSGEENERARGTGACALWCDTDFRAGSSERMTADALLDRVDSCACATAGDAHLRWVVLTGGEPLLQVDKALAAAFTARGFSVAVETNGSVCLTHSVDWLTVSPKLMSDGALPRINVVEANEVKVVLPGRVGGQGWSDKALVWLESAILADNYFVQPMAGHNGALEACIAWVHKRPRWRLSIQTHKLIGLP